MANEPKISLTGFDDLFGTDEQIEAEGAWMQVPGKKDWKIKLRSQYSLKVRNLAQKLMRRHTALLSGKKGIPAEVQDQDKIDLLCHKDGIVTSWEGFDGLPCNQVNVRGVMEQYPPFREICYSWSDDRANYQQEIDEEETAAIKGNSSPASSVT